MKDILKIFAGLGLFGMAAVGCLVIVLCGGCIAIALLAGAGEEAATKDAIASNGGFGSEDKPIPLQTWAKFDDGDVRATQINENADQAVQRMNTFNSTPPAGSRYILVYFEVNCKKKTCNESELDLRLMDDKGEAWGEPFSTVLDPDLGSAVEGAIMEGWQAFFFPSDREIKTIKVEWLSETLYLTPPIAN